MSVHSGRAKLSDGLKAIEQSWRRTREDWQDPVAEQFEKERVEPLIENTRIALSAIARLDEAMHKARRACRADD